MVTLILRAEGWQNGYCTSLENWRPQGLGGSSPSPSVIRFASSHGHELKTPLGASRTEWRFTWVRYFYCPCTLGAGPSCASLAFIVLNPESFVARPFSVDAGT
jgi:hypothetical protein